VRALAGALIAAALLAGCGGGKEGPAASPTAPPIQTPSPTLALTNCDDWTELRPDSRRAFVEQLRIFFGAKVNNTYGVGATLPDDRALVLLSNLCKRPNQGAVKLYKLYGRAAAFTAPG
jgi:hypothetical protein